MNYRFIASLAICFYDTTGNLSPCITGRLGSKIIRTVVDDDGLADNLMDAETVCQKYGEGITIISK